MQTETFTPQLIPLTRWDDGSIRIGNSRVLLDLVVYAFNEGRTPEEIVISYPTLKLSEVYGTITYYLDNAEQIDDYIVQRENDAEQVWTKIESDPNQKRLRQKILAQRTQTSQTDI